MGSVEYFIRIFVVIFFSFFWSSVTLLGLIIQWWKHRGNYFVTKPHSKPKVLDGWKHGYVQLSDVKLHYVEKGDRNKPLMLFLHGFPEFWYSWRYQLNYFDKNYHVVALDMRGYGDSDKPNGIKNYSMQNLIKDVRETIEKLGQSSTILVAHDWGAVVAWYFAMYHPDMVERLVICNVPHPKAFEKVLRSKASQFLKSWYIFLFQCPILPEEWIKTQDYKALEIFFRGRKMGIVNRENFTDEDTEAWKFTFSTNGLTAPINYYRALMQLPKRLRPTKEPVKSKTLILWGENDGALDIEGANLSPSYCENAQLKKIPNCSHWVQQDCPELVNKYIEEFLNEH